MRRFGTDHCLYFEKGSMDKMVCDGMLRRILRQSLRCRRVCNHSGLEINPRNDRMFACVSQRGSPAVWSFLNFPGDFSVLD